MAVRSLARTPGFAAICVLVLSLGLAVTTAAFAVVHTMIRRPLPYPNPERLALLHEYQPEKGLYAAVSWPLFADWRRRGRSWQELGALEPLRFNLGGVSEPESVAGALATGGFFRALSWKTVLGRQFTAEEERGGGARVALISERCWERRFGSDAGVLGREVTIDGEPATVVGVLARIIGRSYYASYEIWMPLEPRATGREARTLEVVGLVRPGTGFAQATAELDGIARGANAGWGAASTPMARIMRHTVPMYLILLTVIGLLLLIVCANIATLQLARATARQADLAVRMALGASRFRIVIHLLGEGLLLAAAGGALGFGLAAAVRQIVVASVPELAELRLDLTVLAFTALASVGAGLLFGLSPALSASRPDLNAMLKSGGRTPPAAAGRRVRGVLVVAEMAVAVTLLTGLGLLVRGFLYLHHTDLGFRTKNVLAVQVSLPAKYASAEERTGFFRLAEQRLRGLAGVDAVAAAGSMPLAGGGGALEVEVEGRGTVETVQGQYTVVMPGYFEALRIPLRRGRAFAGSDTAEAPGAVILSERAARLLFAGQDPLGRRLRMRGGPWRVVAGVAGAARQNPLAPAAPEFYVPHAQDATSSMWLAVGTRADARAFAAGVRRQLRALEGNLQISPVATFDEIISGYFPPALIAGIGGFCLAALLLASLGLYGVCSYVVTQRTHEFGVRMALGAGGREVGRLVVGQALRLAGIGAAIGLAGGAGVARLLSSLLVGIEFAHPLVFAAVAAVLTAVALAASYLPAWRAARLSPIEALRYQ